MGCEGLERVDEDYRVNGGLLLLKIASSFCNIAFKRLGYLPNSMEGGMSGDKDHINSLNGGKRCMMP